jgi:predicted ATPase
MLTRLKVSGFKNLEGVDIRFGPFTCIAGSNGVGKSNLFDAIRFLRGLADQPLIEAASTVRDEEGRTSDIRSLFHRVGDSYADRMSFVAEMIIPPEGVDDLGQPAKASTTFLRYTLELGYRGNGGGYPSGLEIVKEELVHINRSEAIDFLRFPHKAATWRKSVLLGRRTSPLISTVDDEGGNRIIKLHQDGVSGRPLLRPASKLPRTVLSATNAAESPTALLARREMQSWHLLQLEPSALRRPDDFSAPTRLAANGAHLAATLYHLAGGERESSEPRLDSDIHAQRVFSQVANRVAELIDDVRHVRVDRDLKRELLTLEITGRDGTPHPARALSDGTLRFLALAVLEQDPVARGVWCLEEPENGIHPERIPAMLKLLRDIAVDAQEDVGPDNPLRQVIINTHSPAVVAQVPDDSLLVAETRELESSGKAYRVAHFACLPDTWRSQPPQPTPGVAKGRLLAYLNPIEPSPAESDDGKSEGAKARSTTRRVADRQDLQMLLPLSDSAR